MLTFKEILIAAKDGVEWAVRELYEIYAPMLLNASRVEGRFDAVLHEEQKLKLLEALKSFSIE